MSSRRRAPVAISALAGLVDSDSEPEPEPQPESQPPGRVQVTVPDGIQPGETFTVQLANGQEFSVVAPDGCPGGTLIELDVPQTESAPQNADTMVVTVPDGVGPGDAIRVSSGTVEFDVVIPDGVGPGDSLEVNLPVSPPPSPPPSGGRVSRQQAAQIAAETTDVHVGQEVQVNEPGGKRLLGTVVEVMDGAELLYRIKLQGSGLMRTVSEYDIKVLRTSLFVGREVLVRRSNGDVSAGHILEIIDGYEVLYKVRIPDGSAHGYGSVTKMCSYDEFEPFESDVEDDCWEQDDDDDAAMDEQLARMGL